VIQLNLTRAEVDLLLRLTNRATVNEELRRAICRTTLDERALKWINDRLHSATHVARVVGLDK
jgi:hypothetical protein